MSILTVTTPLFRLCNVWIEAVGEDEGRRKEYRITPEGRAAVRAELARWQELTANGEALTRNWT